MRRSAAPSRNFISPTITEKSKKPVSINHVINKNTDSKRQVKTDIQNATRSTDSILSLLSKQNDITEVENDTKKNENTICEETTIICTKNENKTTFIIVWGKKSTKKHKTWEGDGTLEVTDNSAILKDEEGNVLGRSTNLKTNTFEEGSIVSIGGKEVQIIERTENITITGQNKIKSTNTKPEYKKKRKAVSNPGSFFNCLKVVKKKITNRTTEQNNEPLILPIPPSEHQWTHNTNKNPVVDVHVDYCLAKMLRPHQREGIMFLYRNVLGFHNNTYGAILADEMGLGKTLQCITLIWTLLKNGPYGLPILHKVLIVTPSSLVINWQKEFLQWLGQERIQLFIVDSKNKPKDFIKMNHIPVIIISYEMFSRYYEDLENISFDMVICDEGHRLKNNSIKITTLLNQLNCKRRIILTGTPIQNDLQEFYSLVNFVNPNVLGNIYDFKKYFEEPIIYSREPNASVEIQKLGEERAAELNEKTSHFILRRTQNVIDKYLPTKQEVVVFCNLSELQSQLYTLAVEYWENRNEFNTNLVPHLSVIMALKKICNHPSLIQQNNELEEIESSDLILHLNKHLPDWESMTIDDSGKLKITDGILKSLSNTNERIVLISYFTQTLDMLAGLCDHNEYKYCRLDGSTPANQRMQIVDKFNQPDSKCFVFLLSARAGGVGLNLIGASRLILFDIDWNPANDLQAMSRIWRDGQKKSVIIYRLLTAGTIEEKIYQRQISKTGLSSTVVDPQNKDSIRLSDEELKDLFTLHSDVDSITHETLNCSCNGNGLISKEEVIEIHDDDVRECQLGVENLVEQQTPQMNQLMKWEHHGKPFNDTIVNELLIEDVTDFVSFIFRNKCTV